MRIVHQGLGKRSARAQLAVESLERRTLLSGNVIATQSGNQLDLNGDELGNQIMVRSGNTPTEVIVQSMDQTTVNGSQQPVVFEGVTSINASMEGGDDWFKATDLTVNPDGGNGFTVDGGWGDDRIEFKNTTVEGGPGNGITVYGDLNLAFLKPNNDPNTGNDTITFTDTTFAGEAGGAIQIFGEFTTGGEITGGNDTISVTNTVVAGAGETNFGFGDITIYGEYLFGIDTDVSVGGGNDAISLTNSTVSGVGQVGGFANVQVFGDYSYVADLGPNAPVVRSVVGGGNDSVVVDNFDAAGAGSRGAGALLRVTGDVTENQSSNPLSGAEVAGGNDDITLSNVLVAGETPSEFSNSRIEIFGESQPVYPQPTPGFSRVGQGNDRVTLRNVNASADFSTVTIDTALGDDTLDVLNSSFGEFNASLGNGNDYAKLNNDNIFASAHVDGGPGYDVLSAHNNDGLLTFSNFEQVNVT
jgi:hypothetical protein